MSYEILSAKLSQLDREFEQFHANIRFSETESHGQLSQKLAHLRQKNETDRLVFQTKLKFSRSPMVEKRVSSYETIEDFIDRKRAQQNGPSLKFGVRDCPQKSFFYWRNIASLPGSS